ncbi:chromosome partitioning protein [Actinobaculum suis]|uniref:ParA family protein n=1 Tax=Actinobaculum suis TaxID=1657 RepID=UPI000808679A|nr:ParA family protein [Actinobaculum suis]OCA93143.1 chromosome partitioning protein [Actinobaculum suis]
MIIAVCNQKGGVGKTTVATNLAAWLGRDGRVLVVDADPQGNATTTLGVELTSESFTLNDVLAAVAAGQSPTVVRQAIQPATEEWNLVDVLPADRLLASRSEDTSLGRESRLRTALEAIADDYAHIIIDCPPSLGMLTTNALVAADRALIVTTARETAVDGVAEMVSTIATVRTYYNARLSLGGIFINSYRPDRIDARNWHTILTQFYDGYMIPTPLPARELISRAGSSHTPIPAGSDLKIDTALDTLTRHITGTPTSNAGTASTAGRAVNASTAGAMK